MVLSLTLGCGGSPTGPSGLGNGRLTLAVAGVPAGSSASISVTGPGNYQQSVTASQTLSGLHGGTYTITAQPISANATDYNPSPPSQAVAVVSGITASAAVSYTSAASGGLNLRIDGVYLTQSVQTFGGAVPLVADRDGYLRVFVTANQINAATPVVRVRFYHNGTLQSTSSINAPGLSTPQSADEGSLGSSWNLAVPGSLVQAGLSIQVDLDPDNTIAEGNETDNSFPASGAPLALDVRQANPFRVTLVPVLQSVNGRLGNVTTANRDQFLSVTMKMHPLPGYDAVVRTTPWTTNQPAVEASNGNNAWNAILEEIETLRVAEGGSRYYFGVVNPAYSGGVAGIGYVPGRSAIGWDKLPSGSTVAAHEWGHNWGRHHAPCDVTDADPGYPYQGGVIGVFGLDVAMAQLKPSSSHDIMSYCDEEWISDYTYRAVLTHRAAQPAMASATDQSVQPALVVWGRIENGQMILEPAFETTTRPSLPAGAGPYSIEARAADGASIFNFSFTPLEVADDSKGGKHFAFAVPLRPERAARVASIRLTGQGRETSLARASSTPATVDVRSVSAGRVSLRWDATRTPMVVVRDPVSGEILSFARGGRAEVRTDRRELSLGLSSRVNSREVRVSVAGR
ncbi:MAG: CARDB domain-containing protein [Gemmatimonadales bacterium]